MWNGIISWISEDVKNPSELLKAFLTQKSPAKKNLQNLWGFLSQQDEDKDKILQQLFGRVQIPFLKKAIASTKIDLAQSRNDQDFWLVVKHNYENFKQQRRFDPLPLAERQKYSWSEQPYLHPKTDEEHANEASRLFFWTSPMPALYARTLGLDKEPPFLPSILKQSKAVNYAVQTIFDTLKENSSVNVKDPSFSKLDDFVPFQRRLLQYGADAEYPRFVSWKEEIDNWRTHYPETSKAFDKFFKRWKLFEVFDRSIRKKRKDPKSFSIPLGSRFSFDTSFQHYLIQKTLHQVDACCPLPVEMYDQLAQTFLDHENDRQTLSFCLYILKEMFDPKKKPKHALTELYRHTTSHKTDPLTEQAQEILERVCGDSQPATVQVLQNLVKFFSLQKMCETKQIPLTPSLRRIFSVFIYEQEFAPYFSTLYKLALLCPSSFYERLLLAIHDGPERVKKIACLKKLIKTYETSVSQNVDPLEKCKQVLQKHVDAEDDPNGFKIFRLFIFFIRFSYYVELDAEWQNIFMDHLVHAEEGELLKCFDFHKIHSFEQETLPEKRESIFKREDSDLSEEHPSLKASEVFFSEEDPVEQESDQGAVVEKDHLVEYAESLKIKSGSNPKEKRTAYFKEVYNRCVGYYGRAEREAAPAVLTELCTDWKDEKFKAFTVHLNFIKEIENFIRFNLPLETFLNLLLYPFILPNMLDLLQSLKKLRETLLSTERKTLFIPPSLVHQRNTLLSEFFESENVIGAQHAVYAHPAQFNRFLAVVSDCMQLSILPEPVFLKSVGRNAWELFSKKNEDDRILQNVITPFSQTSSKQFLFLSNWVNPSKGNPYLELIFMHTLQTMRTQKIRIPLNISLDTLQMDPNLIRLLKVMIVRIGREQSDVSKEEEIARLNNPLDEISLCSTIDEKYKKLWKSFKSETPVRHKRRERLNLLEFVKQLKIKSREAFAEILLPKSKKTNQTLLEIAQQGNVYPTSDGLSLLPHQRCEEFELNNFQFKEEFSTLCNLLKTAKEPIELHPFCEWEILGEKHVVSFCFDPLHNKARFILNRHTEFTVNLKEYVNTSELENILRWQLLMLKSRYLEEKPLALVSRED